jgi:threonine dehydrogenase-like Zn-dependent dehydrogenase
MVLEAPRQFREMSFPIPTIGPEEFLLRVEMVGICGGDPIEYEGRNRKAHYPLLMGHEVVGRIEVVGELAAQRHSIQVGSRVVVEPYIGCGVCDWCKAGDYHFCREGLVYGVTIPSTRPPHLWGAYSEYMFGAAGARVHRIAEDVPAQAACLTSVLANGVRWVRTRGRGQVGEPVLILGAGSQALSSVIVAKEAGLSPIIVVARGRHPRKLELARQYGADVVVDAEAEDCIPSIAEHLKGRDLPLAVEATGVESMIGVGIAALGPYCRLVLAGTRGGLPANVDIDAIVFKEIDVLGGLGQSHDTELAAAIVNSRRYAVEDMVTATLPLESADEGIRAFMDGTQGHIRIALSPTM